MIRPRHLIMLGGTAIIVLYLWFSDPEGGNLTIPFIAKLATPVIAVLFAHWARKALFDYVDMAAMMRKAKETATGAGLVFLGICIVIFGLLGLFGSQVYASVPTSAVKHLPTLKLETNMYWPTHPKLHTLLV